MGGLGKKIVGADQSMRKFKQDGGNTSVGRHGAKSND